MLILWALQVESELRDVENKSIQDYIRESQNIASLHNQIVNCDQILEVSHTHSCLNPLHNESRKCWHTLLVQVVSDL